MAFTPCSRGTVVCTVDDASPSTNLVMIVSPTASCEMERTTDPSGVVVNDHPRSKSRVGS